MEKIKVGLVAGLAAIAIGCSSAESKHAPSIDFTFSQAVIDGKNTYNTSFSARDADGDLESVSFTLNALNSDFNYSLVLSPDEESKEIIVRKNKIKVDGSVIEFSGTGVFGDLKPGGYLVVASALDEAGNAVFKENKFEIF